MTTTETDTEVPTHLLRVGTNEDTPGIGKGRGTSISLDGMEFYSLPK